MKPGYERAIINMFFRDHLNTAQIARKLNMDEPVVDRIVAAEMNRRAK